jgi:flavin-binding protein dodecin
VTLAVRSAAAERLGRGHHAHSLRRQAPAGRREEEGMSVAKVSEISATSTQSFEDAIRTGLTRASKTLRNIKSAWVKEQQVRWNDGKISEYQVNLMVTFVLDD